MTSELSDNRLSFLLKKTSLFSTLTDQIIREITSVMKIHEIDGGMTVLEENSNADSMLILLEGRFRVIRKDTTGMTMLYNEIAPGEIIGDLNLILEQKRSATVIAVRKSSYAILDRETLNTLLKQFPLELNKIFCTRVFECTQNNNQRSERHQAKTFLVFPLSNQVDTVDFSKKLSKSFSKYGKVNLESPTLNSINFSEEKSFSSDIRIFAGNLKDSEWTWKAFLQADQIIFVCHANDNPQVSELEIKLTENPGFSLMRHHMVILHGINQKPDQLQIENIEKSRQTERTYLIRRENQTDFSRLARFLTNRAIGLVLGGGGARGFAHLGTIRALIEYGIPIDILGGNSMGALIGAQYAAGFDWAQILQQTYAFALGGESLAFPVISLLSGTRMRRDLKHMFGEQKIESMWLPFFAVSCNLSRASINIHDKGSLWESILASNSPAGLLPPVIHNGELLVDGAILDNVPVSAMRMRLGSPLEKRKGNGTIIAVDVNVRETLSISPSKKTISTWDGIKSLWEKNNKTPNIINMLSHAAHVGSTAHRNKTISLADYYLAPPVNQYPILSYKKAEKIAETGYEFAIKSIKEWKIKP